MKSPIQKLIDEHSAQEWKAEVKRTLTDPLMMNNYPVIRKYLLIIDHLTEELI